MTDSKRVAHLGIKPVLPDHRYTSGPLDQPHLLVIRSLMVLLKLQPNFTSYTDHCLILKVVTCADRMITALFTNFRLKFKIKYTEIVSHDKLQSALKSISSRFNSNVVKLTASHSSKREYYTFLQQKLDKGTDNTRFEAWRVPSYRL